jgi:hypothetical protein
VARRVSERQVACALTSCTRTRKQVLAVIEQQLRLRTDSS